MITFQTHGQLKPPNLLYRLLQPVINRQVGKAVTADLATLKRTLESAS